MPKAVSYTKGSIIYFEGDSDDRVYILQSGLIATMTKDVETGAQLSENIKTGEFFGVKSALGHFPREETVTAMQDSVCICMTVPEFENLVSNNKTILMKMLRVFSSQLREVHKRTEAILNNNKQTTVPQRGMVEVAKSFFSDEQYLSCCDVCMKFLMKFSTSPLVNEVKALYKDSKLRYDKLSQMRQKKHEVEDIETEDNAALKQFSLPTFKRFAKTFEQDQVIISEYESGDCFYLIQSGQVQLVKCVNGEKKNLDILKPGEFFGEMAILDNSPRSATCVARGNVEVLEFNKANFEILITGNPQIALILLKLFCKRIYDQKRRLRILTIHDLQARIADVFLMYDEMSPIKNPYDNVRRFNLTINDVASWAGISYEVARGEIERFVVKHKIEIGENEITVQNIADMKRIVDTRSLLKQ